jgi:acetyl/propionyl-CoA carboxylase alpha subunit
VDVLTEAGVKVNIYSKTRDSVIFGVKAKDKERVEKILENRHALEKVNIEGVQPVLRKRINLMTLKEFKTTLLDFGFEKKQIPGVWGYKFNKDIELCIFTQGDFWVEKARHKEFESNYKTITHIDLVKKLLKIT